jgi:hypothetical protein
MADLRTPLVSASNTAMDAAATFASAYATLVTAWKNAHSERQGTTGKEMHLLASVEQLHNVLALVMAQGGARDFLHDARKGHPWSSPLTAAAAKTYVENAAINAGVPNA